MAGGRRVVRRLPAAAVLLVAAALVPRPAAAWSPSVTREVAWRAVEFFPPDLARQVRKYHRAYERGIREGLAAPPAWRAGPPGRLLPALEAQVRRCVTDLRRPVPLRRLVAELGVLAVRVADLNDPLAVAHTDPREPTYHRAYERYVASILDRVEMVYYGQDPDLIRGGRIASLVADAVNRSRSWYPLVGQEFYRTGHLRDWRTFDDRSVAFGIAGVSLSHALSDLANLAAYVWRAGGGFVPPPLPTPVGHVGPTIVVGLGGGFPERARPKRGAPAMPVSSIKLPPP